jgi:hypothetical protein
VTTAKDPLRERFEAERRKASIRGFLTGTGIGIIVCDTWISSLLGIPGGVVFGVLAYGTIYGYETMMWRREHA